MEKLILDLELCNQDQARLIRAMWGCPECAAYIKRITYMNEAMPAMDYHTFIILAKLLALHEDLFPSPEPKWGYR